MNVATLQEIGREVWIAIRRNDALHLSCYAGYVSKLFLRDDPKKVITPLFYGQCKRFLLQISQNKPTVLYIHSLDNTQRIDITFHPYPPALFVNKGNVESGRILQEAALFERDPLTLSQVIHEIDFVWDGHFRSVILQDLVNHIWVIASQAAMDHTNCTHVMQGTQTEFDAYCEKLGMYWDIDHVSEAPTADAVLDFLRTKRIGRVTVEQLEGGVDLFSQSGGWRKFVSVFTALSMPIRPEISVNSGYQV